MSHHLSTSRYLEQSRFFCESRGNITLYDFSKKISTASKNQFYSALIYSVAVALKSHKAWDLNLRSVWLLDNQSIFNLCCFPDFSGKRHNAKRSMNMSAVSLLLNLGGSTTQKERAVFR
jgi:hypothetical protein